MYIKRHAEQPLRAILAGDKVGIILGARQVGKTTLVEHVLADQGPGAVFLNLDIEADKARFRAAAALAPADGLRSLGNPAVLAIDEAQRLPEAARIIKGWHDARLPAKLLLLGSSSLNLLDQAAESLTGRNRKLVLPPLCWFIAEVAKRNALLGSPGELFFWRTRAQSEVDLVVKQGSGLRAFEVKWSPRRVSGRAFRDAYGVVVEPVGPQNPFVLDLIEE
ncbi:AAA family ATPase [uncultured Thiodictyon sp.]|jgi:predicted AAA+ superfamily ATPase|uniref:AAA family ATPase n=1 Tax=uncultured Thiodictyon sp. TaxID=1846217 RepID=UPI0025F44DBC|nr:AAA family ATPase [uncultured Thiodictyon sp.]